ncbi:MAG: Txe/YoeB family addiction module toxin [Bryobacteraceae bacterium]
MRTAANSSPHRSRSCGGIWGSILAVKRDAVFHPEFREDLRHWVETDRRIAMRILELAEAVLRDPFAGIGKPEALKHTLAGAWSRRITQEHRLVYRVDGTRIEFLQARYHY